MIVICIFLFNTNLDFKGRKLENSQKLLFLELPHHMQISRMTKTLL